MKKIYLLSAALLFILSASSLIAQPAWYFSVKKEPFTYLGSGNSMLSAFSDTIALGFNMRIAGVTNDTIYINQRGDISTYGSGGTDPVFHSFGAEHSAGQYSYRIDTVNNKRIMKLQFSNAKFDHDFTGIDYISYQVWLYEVDKSIEIRFGNSFVANPDWSYYFANGGPVIGEKKFWLAGKVDSPKVDTATNSVYLSGTPDSSRVYRFTFDAPTHIAATHVSGGDEINIYPNPSNGSFYIKTGDREKNIRSVTITDMQGRLIYSVKEVPFGDLLQANLKSGIYMVNIKTEETSKALQLVVP